MDNKRLRLQNQSKKIPVFSNYSHRGMLSVKTDRGKEPIYIAEYKDKYPEIAVYAPMKVKLDGKEYWDKKYVVDDKVQYRFSEETVLGKIAGNRLGDTNKKVLKKRLYEMPLFVTDIKMGVDTFTGHHGLGFWDRTPDKSTAKEYIRGTETGVFICLDSFKWEDIKYTNDDLMEAYKEWLDEDGIR